MELLDLLTGEDTHREFIQEYRELQKEQEYYTTSFLAGVLGSLVSHVGRIGIGLYNTGVLLGDSYRESMIQKYNSGFGWLFGEIEFEPNLMIAPDELDNYLETQAATAWDMNYYHAGRCGGDVVLTVAELYSLAKGIVGIAGAAKKALTRIAGGEASYGGVLSLVGGGTAGGGRALNWEVVRVVALEAVAEGAAEGAAVAPAIMVPHSIKDFRANLSKIDGNGLAGDAGGKLVPEALEKGNIGGTVGNKGGTYAGPNKVDEFLSVRLELTGSAREKLLATVQDLELRKIVNELYRPGATVGDGGTAAILAEEFSKGSSTHLLKAMERLKQLNKLANSGRLGLNDLDVVEALIDDLENVISLYN